MKHYSTLNEVPKVRDSKHQYKVSIPLTTYKKLRGFTYRLENTIGIPISPMQALWFVMRKLPNYVTVDTQRVAIGRHVDIYFSEPLYNFALAKIEKNYAFIAKLPTFIVAVIEMAHSTFFIDQPEESSFGETDKVKDDHILKPLNKNNFRDRAKNRHKEKRLERLKAEVKAQLIEESDDIEIDF